MVRLHGGEDALTFRASFGIAVLVTLVPVVLRFWELSRSYQPLTLAEMPFFLLGPQLLVPLAVAFMTPLGVARTSRERFTVGTALVLPYLFSMAVGVLRGFGFGPRFAVVYHLLLFVGGLPLFVYGRRLRRHRPSAATAGRTK
jgi:hypothetical protein